MTQTPSPSGSDGLSTIVADVSTVTTVTTAPVVLLPCSPAADPARGSALARAFAARGWDVCVYCAPDGAAAARQIAETVGALGRRAAVWPMDLSALLGDGGAKAWLARQCGSLGESTIEGTERAANGVASGTALGSVSGANTAALPWSLPRCLVTAPLRDRRELGVASAFDAAEMDAAVRANLSLPLALTHALAAAWQAARHQASREVDGQAAVTGGHAAGSPAARGQRGQRGHEGHPDVVAIHLLDDLDDLAGADGSGLAFGLTQSALHTAIPPLAHALAPWMRVVAVQTPLWTRSESQPQRQPPTAAELADAVCYLARAATITGSTLRIDAGIACAEPGEPNRPTESTESTERGDRRTKASLNAADTASERAAR